MTYAIEAEALEKTFAGKHEVRALDGVSFAVDEGTVFGLLGPNGSGKTTAVRILTTILQADGGTARVLGHDVGRRPREAGRSLIGLAGQYAAVDENLTGRENLEWSATSTTSRRSTVRRAGPELLDQFDLADAGDRTLKTYSGGMRRRLDLAAALVARPTVLFLDEPTTGLDPQSRNDLWEVIERLVGEGTTVLLTTQYLEEADRLADTLVGARPRPGHRRGHPGRAEGQPRCHRARGRLGNRRRRRAHRSPCWPRSAPTHRRSTAPWSRSPWTTGPRSAMAGLRSSTRRASPVRLHPPRAEPRRRLPGPHRPADRREDEADARTRRRHRRVGDGDGRGAARKAMADGRPEEFVMTTAVAAPPCPARPRRAQVGSAGSAGRCPTRSPSPSATSLAYTRIPEALFFSTVQPIMFVLLFRYVFGGAIHDHRASPT